jgi:chaperonin GroEL
MATKQIYIEKNSREVLLKGINCVGDVVKTTLGPRGKTVVINDVITKDGYYVAKSIMLPADSDESIGANLIKKVAAKTVKDAGDSTTTSTLIAQEVIAEGFKLLAAGYKGSELKVGIDKVVNVVTKKISEMSEKIEIDSPKLQQIAAISGNNNKEIGDMISEAFLKTGKNGVITLENSNTGESYLKIVEGMSIERGYMSPIFITNFDKLTCEFDNPYILISEEKIITFEQVKKFLEESQKQQRPLILIAEDFEGKALADLNFNRMRGFPLCLIKSPGFGDNKKQILEDMAAVVGANIANEETGMRTDTLKITDLGSATKVTISKDETIIVGGNGKQSDIDERVRFIKKSIELVQPESWFEKEQLEKRLAKLVGGVGVIYVGAATDVELKEKKDRFEDALKATSCALIEGTCVGGGIALIRCIECLDEIETATDDERAGVNLMKKVLEAPFRQMAKNAELEIAVKEVCGKGINFGYNFKTNKFEDLVEAGVIDPAKVVRVALQNACSVAGTLLTTDSIIINVDEPLPNFPMK